MTNTLTTLGTGNTETFLNQYRDAKEMKELSSPFNKVATFGKDNRTVQVACGDAFTLVLNEKSQVYSFGKLSHGRLGLGQSKPLADDGNNDFLPEPRLIDSLTNEKIVQISAGCRHAAAVSGNYFSHNFYRSRSTFYMGFQLLRIIGSR